MLPYCSEQERAEIDQLLTVGRPIWEPLTDEAYPDIPTPQRRALESQADILLYGGAAGGGKTDLLIGAALTQHQNAILFRREFKQLQGVIDRAVQVIGSRNGLNGQAGVWRIPKLRGVTCRQLEFGSCQHAGDEIAYQGRAHDAKLFDELAHFLESQFRYLSGWLRTTNPKQRTRIIAASNPPTTSEGEWIISFWAPWLDDQHPHPAMPGDLRWFARFANEDKDIEVEGPEPIDRNGELVVPRSRTFIPSSVEDNPYYLRTGYKATLQALPEPLRSQMLRGDFMAGRTDNPWQVIPTEWVKAAQERWKTTSKPPGKMTALGCDPARGGGDETVHSPRWGNWFGEQKAYPGKATPDGPAVAGLIFQDLAGGNQVNIDVIGIGSSVYDHVKGSMRAVPMNGSAGTEAKDRSGQLGFRNKRAEWWWKMREALDPAYGEAVCLPPDPRLRADLCAPMWKLTASGIQVESKDDIIARIGRSPDRGDAAVYAWNETLPPPRKPIKYGRSGVV